MGESARTTCAAPGPTAASARIRIFSRPKSVLAFCACGLAAVLALNPLSSARAGDPGPVGSAPDTSAWYDPAAPTLGTMIGRELDVTLVMIDGRLRYDVLTPAGDVVGLALSELEVRRILPDLDLNSLDAGLDEAGSSQPVEPSMTLMLAEPRGGW